MYMDTHEGDKSVESYNPGMPKFPGLGVSFQEGNISTSAWTTLQVADEARNVLRHPLCLHVQTKR